MEGIKKSIVNYEDDDEDNQSDDIKEEKGKDKEKRSKHSESSKEVDHRHKRQNDHHRHHHHHHRYDTSSRSRSSHRRERSSNSSSKRDYHQRRENSRSPLRSRSDRHYNRSCRKSKFDRKRSRSRESDTHYRHNQRRSRTPEKERKVVKIENKSTPQAQNVIHLPSKPPQQQAKVINQTPIINKVEKDVDIINQQMKPMIELKAPIVPIVPIPSITNAISKKTEQEMKRKLLWGDTKKPIDTASQANKTSTIWNNLKFQGENGSQMTEKFRKLMGIKDEEKKMNDHSSVNNINNDINTNQATLFKNLDEQYSIARMSTHTHRGVGLGFSNNRII